MVDVTIASLKDSIDNLNDSIHSLIKLFKEATEELKMDEHDSELMEQRISPVMKKIKSLEEQNEKIARGIVAVADMLKEKRRPAHQQFVPKAPSIGTRTPLIRPGEFSQPPSGNSQQPSPGSSPQTVQRTPPKQPEFKPLPGTPPPEKKEEKKGFMDMFKR